MSVGDQEHAALHVDGEPFEVVSLSGTEAISELFRYEVVCAVASIGHEPQALIGAEAKVRLRDGFGAERVVSGIVTEAEERAFDHGSARLTLVVRPAAWALTLQRGCRVFQELSAQGIVERVLGGAPRFGRSAEVRARWELSAVYAAHGYCAQYREDDWSFVRRLLEEEGMYAWFDHADGESVLVFGDDSSRAPELAGGARIAFALDAGMRRSEESILELGMGVRVAASKFTVGSFNPEKPRLQVQGSAGGGEREIYEAGGGGPASPDGCGRLARFMAEAAAAGARGVRGTSTSVRLVPGMIVEVTEHPLARLDGRYLVASSSCTVTQRRRGAAGASSDERPFLCRFQLIPSAAPFRLPRVTPRGKQAGLQLGVVVGPQGAEIHPDASGQVRVQHHWDREGQRDADAGKWMRVAQRGTADSMQLPRIGWNVATFNEEGEIDAPSVLSRLHDAEHPPAYPLPANKTRVVFKTATTPGGGSFNEIYFEDQAGAEEMFVNASKDMRFLVQNDRAERVSRDASRAIGHDHEFYVEADYEDVVKRDQRVTIGHDETIEVDGSAEKLVTGDETSTIAGRRSLDVGGKHTDKVGETRRLTVGAAQIDTTLGLIASTAKRTSILVGGAMIRATASAITESHGWVSVQTIGGAKIELVKKSRVVDVKKNHIETVGGAVMLTTGGAYRDHAKTSSSWTTLGVAALRAPVIVLEATERLQLAVGSSVITITPDEITIAASTFDLSKSSAVVMNTAQASYN
ncbi:type VI secretion system Vgr family protein [Chondromyces crocatus]|uniref:Gp5/Type VI secretion system Vgr C-terminal trimerisation domain-containing protein n=1 Tax=Chondromyces crocatus TaxID=52 RepID=A0A0K1EBW5_CHOCO|nr:type VI secretion system tip protein TssI/VgrG [Chondromyces crocatus]AKT38167.1 uncharacterized protein CMC5_023100 [Chondromyces crocatus]